MYKSISRRQFLRQSSAFLSIAGSITILTQNCEEPPFDIIIRGGHILDGSGKDAFTNDIGIKNGQIIAIENLSGMKAKHSIKADGLYVSPGFIDIHSHTDQEYFINPKAESKIRQGVTTEIAGQDGRSLAPMGSPTQKERIDIIAENIERPVDWKNFNEFFNRLEQNKLGTNFAAFIGLGTVREYVIGYEDRSPSDEEMVRMKKIVQDAFTQGIWGISTGLEYIPGSFASTEEVIELCKVMPKDGLYASHIRNEDNELLEAVEETLRIGREAEIPIHISHLKASGKQNWDKREPALIMLETAITDGMKISCDRYPYTAYSTGLGSLFPIWSREGGDAKFIERLQDVSLLPKIKNETLEKVNMIGSWEAVLISDVKDESHKIYQGKRIPEIVSEAKDDPFEFCRQLLIAENNQVDMCGFAMSDENTEKILAHPITMIASDGSALATYGKLAESKPHSRNFGTFPRVLGHYVREKNIMPLAEAIRKMTSFPAERLGIRDRGVIAVGKAADIVLFDAERVIDKATYVNPHQYPEGIEYVILNGQLAVEEGEHTGQLAGKVLRRGI